MNLIDYFKALSDKTRLRLLNILLHYELNVNEIVSVLGMSQPRISRHLKILLNSGLIKYRRDGLWLFYSAISNGDSRTFIESMKNLIIADNELKPDIEHSKKIIENRSKETIHFFDSIAGDWSKLKQDILGNFDINNLIAQYLKKCKLSVDLGCGTGDLIPLLLNYSDKVIGVDRSPKMIEQAGRLLAGYADRVSLRLGGLEHLPLADNEADFAVANMVLHHLSSPLDAIQEIYRVLNKHGSLIIADILKHNIESMRTKYGDRWLGFEEEDIKKWLTDKNFYIKEKAKFEIQNELKLILFLAIKQ